MNLSNMLAHRAETGRPVRVALIGAGKFGSMYLTQARLTVGVHITAIVDLDPARARRTLATCGWPEEQSRAMSLDDACAGGATFVTDDLAAVLADERIEVVIEATGDPSVGIRHALAVIEAGKHVVMVNVEADVLGRTAARPPGRTGRCRLFAGLGRPAGADLRACRLGARLRLQGRVRGQGAHATSPPITS